LTQLSKSRGGHFPYLEIRSIIDGRSVKNSNRSHFKGDMPIWGDVFVNSKNSSPTAAINGEAVAKMRILNIVDYLAGIQEK
jgi:sensor domain CHASE-containing protein